MSTARLETGKALLAALKQSTQAGQLALVLPVGQPVQAVLRLIPTQPGALNAQDLQLLSDWRNRYVQSFLTIFHAHPERTARWLTEFVGPSPAKILFMVEDLNGVSLGHIGLDFINWETGYGEADAIVSGGSSPKGLMKLALQTALRWARDQLGLSQLGVRVRSDNTALTFYQKTGFVEQKRVPISARQEGDMQVWSEDPSSATPEPSLVYMLFDFDS
jgi:RimJ/RimL family protein N-acetyltransferase